VGLTQTSVDEAMSQMLNRTVAIGVGLVGAGLLVSVGLAMLLVRSGGRAGARKSGVS